MMRTGLFGALAIIVAGLVLAAAVVDLGSTKLPAVAPSVEAICIEAMRRSPPDLSIVRNREENVQVKTVTLGELPLHGGEIVRVAGVIHVEFEWVGLYSSRAALEEGERGPWVRLGALWPDEPYWQTRAPAISDRCAVVEGTYLRGLDGHIGISNGTIDEIGRLDVWSVPHRPFITTPPLPPPPK